MLRQKHILVFALVSCLLAAAPLGQDKEKIKKLTPTHRGSTGLFNLYVADTLRQGEFSLGASAHKFYRDPGKLDYTIFPVSLTLGLTDRIELFGSFEAYKRVNADDILVNKVLPGGPIVPTRLRNGLVAFYNDSPFMDTGFGDGTGDLWAGVKFNLLSERHGNPFGFAVQPIARFHLTNDRQHLLRGLTSGATDGGVDLIISKNIKGGGTVTGNFGWLFADDINNADRQHSFNWGGGFELPFGDAPISVIGEVLGRFFYGSERTSNLVNDNDPVDAYAGLRVFPAKWMALSAAASYHLTSTDVQGAKDSDCLGFYVQAAFNRKINRPPTASCAADRTTVTEGESVRITATVDDSDDDSLAVTWKASGGRLSQADSSATLDTTGLAAGRYSVMAEVSDGAAVASCSVDVTVEKRKMAPTIACEPATVSVMMGQSTTLTARASDPNGDPLTYAWTVDGQSVTNNQPSFQFGTAGKSVGRHTVRVTVTDSDGMSASCEFTVTITEKPNNNPTCSLEVTPAQVFAGEAVNARATASDPDNDPLKYAWRVDGQSRSETGNSLSINTSGMTGGSHSVTLTVTDDRGGSCTATKSFAVVEKIVIQMTGLRPDNKAKARLDEIALKMQQTPQLRARVTGYTDSRGSERANQTAGQRRADSVKDYLVKQHKIDAGRIETKSGGSSNPIADNATEEGRRQNRRVEIELYVP